MARKLGRVVTYTTKCYFIVLSQVNEYTLTVDLFYEPLSKFINGKYFH